MWHRLFPLGLYGTLLLACVALLFPAAAAPVERALLGLVALPLRTHGLLVPRPVHAAQSAENAGDALTRHLEQALREDLLHGTGSLRAAGWVPTLCRVVGWHRDRSGRRVDGLVLDRGAAELTHCEPWVTYGGALVGVLAPAGTRPTEAGPGADPDPRHAAVTQPRAEVHLLHHPDAPPVAVGVALPDAAPQRAIASQSGVQDPWPLQLELWRDPYLAMRLDTAGLEVRTVVVPGRVDPGPPAGLLVGRTRPWGYRDLAIGMFVAPDPDPARVAAVVVWRRAGAPAPADKDGLRLGTAALGGGSLRPIPGEVPLAGGGAGGGGMADRRAFTFGLPDGIARVGGDVQPGVVVGGRWWGTLRPLIWGHGVATPVAAGADFLSLLVLPLPLPPPGTTADPSVGPPPPAPRVWRMRRIAGDGRRLWLRWVDPRPGERLPRQGVAFSGVQGTGLPAGLVLGACETVPGGDGRTLVVDLPDVPQDASAWVWAGEAPL